MTQSSAPIDSSQDGSGRLWLPEDRPLVPALVAAFRQVLGYAGEMAELVEQDPRTAVHEYRKSLRRARSVLRMLRPAVPGSERRALRDLLRGLAQPTSLLRDADVLGETCDALVLTGPAAEALARVRQDVAARQAELLASRQADDLLKAGAGLLPEVIDRLEAAVALDTPADHLVTAFERTWKRARRARKAALAVRTDETLHTWRKRVKEVRYQLELLAESEPGPVDGLRAVLAAQAKRLGNITDVIALRRYLRTHAGDLEQAASDALDVALGAHIDRERDVAVDKLADVRARLLQLGATQTGVAN